ncbi:cell division protein SepF [Streptomyces sp. 4F14]|uniref:cell division protein SepF n=1 Tax=Streptomyces sp. 4F14 TaxID=3394380 RepID=UPI003A878D32
MRVNGSDICSRAPVLSTWVLADRLGLVRRRVLPGFRGSWCPSRVNACESFTDHRASSRARAEARDFRGHRGEGTPLIVSPAVLDHAQVRGLVDFAAGLVFEPHDGIERVTQKVFLLSPSRVDSA